MNGALKPLAACVLTAVLAAEMLLMAVHARLDFPFLAPALLGAVVVQIRSCRSHLELLASVPLAVCLALARFGPHLRLWRENAACLGLFLGLASLFLLGSAVLRSRPHELADRVKAFGVALAAPVFVIITAALLSGTGHAHPVTFDKVLYAFDGSLGFQPSFLLGRLLTHLAWLGFLAKVSYEQVPVAVLILYTSAIGMQKYPSLSFRAKRGISPGLENTQDEIPRFARNEAFAKVFQHPAGGGTVWPRPNILWVIGAASLVGYLLYGLLPAAGPRYLFPSCFPDSVPPLAGLALLPAALSADSPRNAMPSLHMAWAVLLCWNARGTAPWLRAGYILYLVLTVLFTLGSGEHYLIDLVVAMPLALAVQSAFSVPIRQLSWSIPFWSGAVGVLAWLGFLRWAASVWSGSALLDWSLMAVSVAGAVVLERQAYRRFRAVQGKQRQKGPKLEFKVVSAPL